MWVILNGDISTIGPRTTIRVPFVFLGRDDITLRVIGYKYSFNMHHCA